LHKRITPAEWKHLERTELVTEYLRDSNWREIRDLAAGELDRVHSFYRDKINEETGGFVDNYPEHAVNDDEESLPTAPDHRTDVRSWDTEPTARGRIRSSEGCMHSRLLPRGGVDGTLPQWVYVTAVELWMPAE